MQKQWASEQTKKAVMLLQGDRHGYHQQWVTKETGVPYWKGRAENKGSLGVKRVKTRNPGRQVSVRNPQKEQAQKWVRKPSPQGATSRVCSVLQRVLLHPEIS